MLTWRWPGRAANTALVLGVGLVAVSGLVVQAHGIDTAAEWAALVAVVASAGALYLRRRFPVAVGFVALAAVSAYGALLHRPGPIMLVFVVALYTVVDEGYLAIAIGLGLASVIAFAAADSANRTPESVNGATLLHAGWLAAVIVGVTRNRRAYLAEAQARVLAAEQGVQEEARRRATEERLRIARELHDALGHHLSMINVQASAALHRPDPGRSEQALTAIKQASKETLQELRTTLGILRQDGEPPAADPPAAIAGHTPDRAAPAGTTARHTPDRAAPAGTIARHTPDRAAPAGTTARHTPDRAASAGTTARHTPDRAAPDGAIAGQTPDEGSPAAASAWHTPDDGSPAEASAWHTPGRQSPAPGLDRLYELVTTAGRSGLEIRTELAETRPLPPEVDLAAYRIVQEALTNITRHAGATAAVIRVRPDRDGVLVEVVDDGTRPPGTPGNGILGMGERARALGGSLSTGPAPDGGFRVRARLPLQLGQVGAA